MKNYIDRKILETLIAKYGKSNVNLAINRLNENNENPKSGIFIESHDHLNCDAFRILVLDSGVNVLKNDPLEIKCEGRYSGKQYIEKLEPKYDDYITIDYVHSYSNELCLTKVVKELHTKYPNLPIYCFTEGFYTFNHEYKNVQKLFNDIFSKYLKNLSFEFIPGTMGEFLKSDMNESLKTNIVNEITNESDDSSMYDAFGEVIYPGDYVIVVAHNDKYPEGKMLKGTFVKLAANSRLVGVIEIEEYDQKMYKFPKYIKEPQICIAKYK